MVDEHMKKRALKITDIAEMIYLAEGVLWEARHAFMYSENGVMLHGDEMTKQLEKDRQNGIENLVEQLLHSIHDLTEAIETTPEKILTTLSPIKSRILGMFRNGEVQTEAYMYDGLYADPSVPDDWLFTMFLMRVRDRMIVFGAQRMHDKYKERRAEKENI